MAIFISFNSFNLGYFVQPCKIPCSMQHVVCQRNSTGPCSSSIEDTFQIKIHTGRQSWLGYGGCSFVPIDQRITRLLSAPLVNVRIRDWLCVLPAITLVVDKSKKLNKAASSD